MVTGCSSGIGRAAAMELARQGYLVFAGVRRPEAAEALRSLGQPNLLALYPLDLTKGEDIAGAGETVRQQLRARGIEGLWAVINNAGGGQIAPIELMDVGILRAELETRIAGPVALLQELLPLLRQARGRVVWISTPALTPIAWVSSVHACDFAVNCMARTLNLELKGSGVRNVLIRCGGIATASPARTEAELERSLAQWPRDRVAYYEGALRREQSFYNGFDAKRTPPQQVAQAVARALNARRPPSRLQVGYLSRASQVLELLPQTWVDFLLSRR